MRVFTWLVVLAACNPGSGNVPTDSDTDADTDGDTDPDTDTEPSGTDEDGDGWTVEEGDCDDTNVFVNPDWPEDSSDDVDNDCDGRIDERLVGLAILDASTDGTAESRLQVVDTFGELGDTVTISDGDAAYAWMDAAADGDGYAFVDYGWSTLTEVTADGAGSTLVDFTTLPDFEDEDDPPPFGGPLGLATHPDGYYLVGGGDRLWRVDTDGTVTELARWSCFEPPDGKLTDVCPISVAVDSVSGEVGMFGLYGGFAKWTEADGLQVYVADDTSDTQSFAFVATRHKPRGAFFGLGFSVELDGYGLFKYDADADAYELKGAWPNADYTPHDFTIDEELGDFYVTANGGWFYTVWRMTEDGEYTGQLYSTDGDEPGRAFQGITGVWDEDAAR